ncbi:uncharacterized protein METZ01_LOCUS251163, partial [marine metagenome]
KWFVYVALVTNSLDDILILVPLVLI